MAHAIRIYQPSGFKRTMMCPGWGNLCKGLPPKPASKYAAEGSVAHYLGETCLNQGRRAVDFLGAWGWYNNGRTGLASSDVAPPEEKGDHFIFQVTDEMAAAVQTYLDEVNRRLAGLVGGQSAIEQKLDLSWLVPGMFGTGDHVAVEPLGRLYVTDYKHGAGVAVEVEDNPQLMIYALGAIGKDNPHMVEEVEVTIVQPRAVHPAGPVRSIRYDAEDLIKWGYDVLLPAAKKALMPDAILSAGGWCTWCDGREICPEIRRKMFDVANVQADTNLVPVRSTRVPPNPALLNGEQLDRVLEFCSVFEGWIKGIREEAYKRLEKGAENAPRSVKLVEGRMGKRTWAPSKDVYDALKTKVPRKDVFIPEVLKSPAQVEHVLKARGLKHKQIKELIDPLVKKRNPGRPAMVPADDPREALPSVVTTMFG